MSGFHLSQRGGWRDISNNPKWVAFLFKAVNLVPWLCWFNYHVFLDAFSALCPHVRQRIHFILQPLLPTCSRGLPYGSPTQLALPKLLLKQEKCLLGTCQERAKEKLVHGWRMALYSLQILTCPGKRGERMPPRCRETHSQTRFLDFFPIAKTRHMSHSVRRQTDLCWNCPFALPCSETLVRWLM